MEKIGDKVVTSPSQVAFHVQNNAQPTAETPVEQQPEQTKEQAEKLAEELSPKTEEQGSPKSVLQHIFDRTQKH